MYDPQMFRSLAAAGQHGDWTRAIFATVAAGGNIYAIGGQDQGEEILATDVAFDPLLGAWAEVASMSVKCHLRTSQRSSTAKSMSAGGILQVIISSQSKRMTLRLAAGSRWLPCHKLDTGMRPPSWVARNT